jgi:hypothetical protein
MEQSDANEMTPSLPKQDVEGGPVSIMKQKKNALRDKKVQEIKQSVRSSEKRFKIILNCLYFCGLGFIFLGLDGIYYYYSTTFKERDLIDQRAAIVHEQWIDYLAPDVVAPEWPYTIMRKQVNCTNLHPCLDWDCLYVKEHFHKTPDECQYDDYMKMVTIVLSILGSLGICNCLFGN